MIWVFIILCVQELLATDLPGSDPLLEEALDLSLNTYLQAEGLLPPVDESSSSDDSSADELPEEKYTAAELGLLAEIDELLQSKAPLIPLRPPKPRVEDWYGEFRLKDGSCVIHTPQTIIFNGREYANSLYFGQTTYTTYALNPGGLNLKTRLNFKDFVKQLIKSGLYDPDP